MVFIKDSFYVHMAKKEIKQIKRKKLSFFKFRNCCVDTKKIYVSVLATLIFARYFEVIVVQNHRDDALKCLMGQEEWAFERRNRGARSTNLISEKRRKVVTKK